MKIHVMQSYKYPDISTFENVIALLRNVAEIVFVCEANQTILMRKIIHQTTYFTSRGTSGGNYNG